MAGGSDGSGSKSSTEMEREDPEMEREAEDERADEEDERRRVRLVEAISALRGGRKKPLGERSEAAVRMSEFAVTAEGERQKVQLSDLIGGAKDGPAVPTQTRKQLQNLRRSQKTVEQPLSRQESERVQRDLAFQKAAVHVSRWKSVVIQNRKAEQLVFPQNQEPAGPKPLEKVVSGWKAQTPLEQEVFNLLSANKQPIHDPVLTPAEEASLRAMSLEEAQIRRAELQKVRALQSYYEAKARRERKIKSKKYHRVQNKARRREFLKQFEQMVKTDPTGALEELNKMELARMKERMSLKHQNSGKWARAKAVMAKYDQGARRAMQQQLELNKDLTQKVRSALSTQEEQEEDAASEPELLPDFVNDAEPGQVSSNPWMRGELSAEPAEPQRSEQEEAGPAEEEEEEEEKEVDEEEELLREFESRRKLRQEEEQEEPAGEEEEESAEEEEGLSEFRSLFKGVTEGLKEEAAAPANSAPLEEGLMRIRTVEDVELLPPEDTELRPPTEAPQPPPKEEAPPSGKKARKKRKRDIELKEVLTKKAKTVTVPLAPTTTDAADGSDEELDQRGLIMEAFAGDDVVADFLKDKRKQEDAAKPKVVDLTLPGWGEWGGQGLKPSSRKRQRFRVKVAPAEPRKDQRLPAVIISEQRNSSLGAHQVSSLPFPFDSHAQFESTVRTPLGRTWNTERTVKKLTKPKVLTQLGSIIEPMTEEELTKNKEKKVLAEGAGKEDPHKTKRQKRRGRKDGPPKKTRRPTKGRC
ncbi:U3 small nucleolar RNA-associated protein 14 homolog A [Oryzias melastigma]|uniref:UTP14C small subunit processome component n=1 Tax=Oryzias melastigma TaxID=30732 RepID=A0A3B3CCH5_ORYME|nr:U3 small nucleolar RNA-associated protein 14 homolog A [Oryzias melastigma]